MYSDRSPTSCDMWGVITGISQCWVDILFVALAVVVRCVERGCNPAPHRMSCTRHETSHGSSQCHRTNRSTWRIMYRLGLLIDFSVRNIINNCQRQHIGQVSLRSAEGLRVIHFQRCRQAAWFTVYVNVTPQQYPMYRSISQVTAGHCPSSII